MVGAGAGASKQAGTHIHTYIYRGGKPLSDVCFAMCVLTWFYVW